MKVLDDPNVSGSNEEMNALLAARGITQLEAFRRE
mgnify:CR=1 FL=1